MELPCADEFTDDNLGALLQEKQCDSAGLIQDADLCHLLNILRLLLAHLFAEF